MNDFSYNLIDEAWIPVKTKHGKEHKYGLLELLGGAHEIIDLVAPAPVVTGALYRLLLAICGRVFGPKDCGEWKRLWERRQFDAGALEEYFHTWRSRFDLFDERRPFYQAEDQRVQPKKLLRLIPHLSSGNNATLFDHSTEDRGVDLSPEEAAQYLVAMQAYALGGLSGIPEKFTGAPPVRGISFFVQGNNLFETLLLNLISPQETMLHAIPPDPGGADAPCWEMADPFAPRKEPYGLFDYLTWQNRRVKLFPIRENGQVVVRTMTEAPGLRLDASFIDGIGTRDPYQYYRLGSLGPTVLRFSEERAIWRDSAALYQFEEREGRLQAPPNLLWLHMLARRGMVKKQRFFRIRALGLAADKAKTLFYGDESLPLPAAYLENFELVNDLASALGKAEGLVKTLYAAASCMAETMIAFDCDLGGRKPDKQLVEQLREHLRSDRVYWSGLEPGFYALVEGLQTQPDQAMQAWEELLCRQTLTAWDYSATLGGDDARAMKAGVKARGIIFGGLRTYAPRKETIDG